MHAQYPGIEVGAGIHVAGGEHQMVKVIEHWQPQGWGTDLAQSGPGHDSVRCETFDNREGDRVESPAFANLVFHAVWP
ncbi:hypothetical protein GCM10011247_25750 [Pseudomonas plecoglossicida]|nr:hypothetical protein GCM10011247_25750 [Pseudomonas plecoglossicida]